MKISNGNQKEKKKSTKAPAVEVEDSDTDREIEIDLRIQMNDSVDAPKTIFESFKVNLMFMAVLAVTMGSNGINIAWATGGNNQLVNLYAAKLDWTKNEIQQYTVMVNFATYMGLAAGALSAGFWIGKSRKNVFIIFNVLAIPSLIPI